MIMISTFMMPGEALAKILTVSHILRVRRVDLEPTTILTGGNLLELCSLMPAKGTCNIMCHWGQSASPHLHRHRPACL